MAIKIYVDQGHNPAGNVNAGATGNGLNEGEITYNVGAYLADILDSDERFLVRTSRNTPTEVLGTSNASSLATRVRQIILSVYMPMPAQIQQQMDQRCMCIEEILQRKFSQNIF